METIISKEYCPIDFSTFLYYFSFPGISRFRTDCWFHLLVKNNLDEAQGTNEFYVMVN